MSTRHKRTSMIQIDTIWYNGGEMEVIRDLDSVKRLVAENARLREMLENVADFLDPTTDPHDLNNTEKVAEIRAALTPQPANT